MKKKHKQAAKAEQSVAQPVAPKRKQRTGKDAQSNNIWFVLLTLAFTLAAIAVNILYQDLAFLYRVLIILAFVGVAIFSFTRTTLGQKTIALARGTQFELRKVTWPTRNETLQSAGMVFVFVLIVGLLLWLIDSVFIALINLILG